MKNRRLISGNRVIARCSLDLPKVDPFDNIRIHREGFLVFNTRGGCLYLAKQFTDLSINKLFKPDEPSLIKNIRLYPKEFGEVKIGDLQARFMKFREGGNYSGMVL